MENTMKESINIMNEFYNDKFKTVKSINEQITKKTTNSKR